MIKMIVLKSKQTMKKSIHHNFFQDENDTQVEKELNEPGRDEHTEKLFDQDLNEEEDFEIPAFLRKQKF